MTTPLHRHCIKRQRASLVFYHREPKYPPTMNLSVPTVLVDRKNHRVDDVPLASNGFKDGIQASESVDSFPPGALKHIYNAIRSGFIL